MSEPREIKIDLTDNYRLVYDFCGNKFLQKKPSARTGKLRIHVIADIFRHLRCC